MAAFDTARTAAAFAPRSLFAALYTNTLGAVIAWNDARETRNALGKLSAHELADIGFVRGDVDEVARGRRY
ncbi:MAG: DUF1127 domain-containing protein [Shimia sp.]